MLGLLLSGGGVSKDAGRRGSVGGIEPAEGIFTKCLKLHDFSADLRNQVARKGRVTKRGW